MYVENEPPVKKVKTVMNAEDTKKFCDEFSEELEYICFGDTDDKAMIARVPILIFSFRILMDTILMYELMTTRTYSMQVFQKYQRRI